jgi:Tfp pilus assembly protein PilF
VSRIHDALRQRRQPGVLTSPPRPIQADAVLAALGFRPSGSARRAPVLFALAAAVSLVAILGATYWPASTPPLRQTRHVAANLASTSAPVSSSPVEARRPTMHDATTMPTTVRAPATPVASRATNGERQAAPASFRSADPGDFQLALYYQRAGDFEHAMRQYQKVLQRDEFNIGAHNNLGLLYQSRGLYEDAVREFQRVVATDPRYVTAHLNLSAAFLELGRADAAAAEARAVLAIEPGQSDALVNLGLAQAATGQPGEAKLSLTRALEIDPHHAAAHYNLAQVYEKSGESRLAVDHYRQFLQFAGTDQTAYVADVRARIQALTRGRRP